MDSWFVDKAWALFFWTVVCSLMFIWSNKWHNGKSPNSDCTWQRLHISTAQKDSYPIYLYTDFSYVAWAFLLKKHQHSVILHTERLLDLRLLKWWYFFLLMLFVWDDQPLSESHRWLTIIISTTLSLFYQVAGQWLGEKECIEVEF